MVLSLVLSSSEVVLLVGKLSLLANLMMSYMLDFCNGLSCSLTMIVCD